MRRYPPTLAGQPIGADLVAIAISLETTPRADGAFESTILAGAFISHGDPPTLHADNEDYDAELYLALLRWDASVLDKAKRRELKATEEMPRPTTRHLRRDLSADEFQQEMQLNDNSAGSGPLF